jgi:type IV pilus assembly protein PilB
MSTTVATDLDPREVRQLFVDTLDLLTAEEFEAAEELSRQLRMPLVRAVADRGRIPLPFLLEQLAESWGVKYAELKVSAVQPEALAKIREDAARRLRAVPFAIDGKRLLVAMTDPRDQQARRELGRLTGLEVVAHLALDSDIQRALLLYRGELQSPRQSAGTSAAGIFVKGNANPTAEADTATPVLDRLLEHAVLTGASDIHIEPYQEETLVRCRVDGVLRDAVSLPAPLAQPLAARIKALSGMRLDERRAPQDGRLSREAGGVSVELRVSTMPTQWGEKVVMRVLPAEAFALDLEGLGLGQDDYDVVLRNLTRPYGMVLVTGPTGSGKSTTLYAMLMRLAAERRNTLNISTIEDPVEHPLPRVSQVSVNPAAGIDFAAGLRALLRQDPDVIMVGEIRDRETADVAVRTALVGRLLLSTLHTNDTSASVPRLIDMGVEPFLHSSTLSVVIAQRLVRRVCPACRESAPLDPRDLALLQSRPDALPALHSLRPDITGEADLERLRVFRGRGCRQCAHSGYRGRIGLFEVMEMTDEIRRQALARTDANTIRSGAIAAGMRTMFRNGLAKVLLGETTLEEVARVAA